MTTSRHSPERHLFVVFGGTGDLMHRKILPALHRLERNLDEPGLCTVLGIARDSSMDDSSYREWALDALREAGYSPSQGDTAPEERFHYHAMPEGDEDDYQSLTSKIQSLEDRYDLTGNRVFYLALPPKAFPTAIRGIGEAGLAESPGWTRLVVEKPFGHDLASARELNQLVHDYFQESQIFRIDHYLGKETVQNLLVFRFANPLFESLWNREHIDNVQITVAESLGVGSRAGYYDQSGALRDMVQNHLNQLLTLVTMEAPNSFDAASIRDEKNKVLGAVDSIRHDDVVFGQYRRGRLQGEEVPGYREEDGVDDNSDTETFVSLKLNINNWRWNGVPFYLRTGKRLPRKLTQVDIVFEEPPVCLFENLGGCQVHQNVLRLTLQPEEGFSLYFEVKKPGEGSELVTQPLNFKYSDVFEPLPDAYQTLIRDIIRGDQTLFVRGDEVEKSWKIYTPILEDSPPLQFYETGSWGPGESNELLTRKGRTWRVSN